MFLSGEEMNSIQFIQASANYDQPKYGASPHRRSPRRSFAQPTPNGGNHALWILA